MIPSLQQILTEHMPGDWPLPECRCGARCPDDIANDDGFDAWWAAHVDEVWQHTHTITTVEELDALPVRSVVLQVASEFSGQQAWQRNPRGWQSNGDAVPSSSIWRYAGMFGDPPRFTVLYIPTAPEED